MSMFTVIRHWKTQSLYIEQVEPAKFQVSKPDRMPPGVTNHLKGRVVYDGDEVIVYRNLEGMTFVRFPDEMSGDRFENIA
jgi:hypothetical protein